MSVVDDFPLVAALAHPPMSDGNPVRLEAHRLLDEIERLRAEVAGLRIVIEDNVQEFRRAAAVLHAERKLTDDMAAALRMEYDSAGLFIQGLRALTAYDEARK